MTAHLVISLVTTHKFSEVKDFISTLFGEYSKLECNQGNLSGEFHFIKNPPRAAFRVTQDFFSCDLQGNFGENPLSKDEVGGDFFTYQPIEASLA